MRIKTLISRYFDRGNVSVFGLRGTGKDVLFGNVIARRNKPYVSNIDYGYDYHEFDYSKVDIKSDYRDFIKGTPKPYKWRYPMGADIYLSDCGVYFPAQYCGELNRDYKSLSTYVALSRQVSHNNVHTNAQCLNRVYDKLREQSEFYIMCRGCKILFGIAFMKIRIYEKYQSAVDRVRPFKMTLTFKQKKDPVALTNYQLAKDKYANTYGEVFDKILIFKNKSKHDTYFFENYLKGEIVENTQKNPPDPSVHILDAVNDLDASSR